MTPASAPPRPGFALIAVVLALVVLEAAIAAALFVGALEATSTRAFADRARVALAAESALARALAPWDADAIAALPVGGTLSRPVVPVAGGSFASDARVQRLAHGGFLVTGKGSALAGADTPATATAVALVRWHAPAEFSADAPAAVVAGGTVLAGASARVDGRAPSSACHPVDSLAAAAFPPAAAIVAPAAVLLPGASIVGASAAGGASTSAAGSFGPLGFAALAAAADRTETGSVTLAPVAAAGTCDVTAPGNWGAPANVAHPCAASVPLVHAPGDLTVAGGAGQALLLVGGDLTVAPGAEIDGVVLVLGNAIVAGTVRGLVRAGGDVRIDGNIQRDACALWRAVTRPAALGRPFRGRRWRLPPA